MQEPGGEQLPLWPAQWLPRPPMALDRSGHISCPALGLSTTSPLYRENTLKWGPPEVLSREDCLERYLGSSSQYLGVGKQTSRVCRGWAPSLWNLSVSIVYQMIHCGQVPAPNLICPSRKLGRGLHCPPS